jgi:hypothetical protein
MDGAGQFSKTVALIHWIAPAERDVGIRVSNNDSHKFFGGHLTATLKIPRLRIMTALAGMATSSAIDGGPEPWSIHHRIFYDI